MCKHLTSRSNWNLEVLVIMEGGKAEDLERLSEQGENHQQTLPTFANHWNRTRVTEVGGECFHHHASLVALNEVRKTRTLPTR